MSVRDRSDSLIVIGQECVGSYISREGDEDIDVRVRKGKASTVFQIDYVQYDPVPPSIDRNLHIYKSLVTK